MPLHTIEAQLVLECERLGIPAMAGSQVTLKYFSWKKLASKLSQISPTDFNAAMAGRPKLLVCSVEFLADPEVDRDDPNLSVCQISQVRNVILKVRLSPAGTRPIVCVGEAQVSRY